MATSLISLLQLMIQHILLLIYQLNDNWFTVRAIDIATGVVSEKSRGINVDHLLSLF
jgi:hypothetical protein